MRIRALAAAIALAISGNTQSAGITGNTIEEITVFGSNKVLTGNPLSATEGYVFGAQLQQFGHQARIVALGGA